MSRNKVAHRRELQPRIVVMFELRLLGDAAVDFGTGQQRLERTTLQLDVVDFVRTPAEDEQVCSRRDAHVVGNEGVHEG